MHVPREYALARHFNERQSIWVIYSPLKSKRVKFLLKPPPPPAVLSEEGRERGKRAEMAGKRAQNGRNSGGREGEGRKMRPQRRRKEECARSLSRSDDRRLIM